MYCSASATLCTTSDWRITGMAAPRRGGRASMVLVVARRAAMAALRRKDAVDRRDRHGRQQEGAVDDGLVEQRLVVVRLRVDEGAQQVDRRDADDRRGELDLQHARVHVR